MASLEAPLIVISTPIPSSSSSKDKLSSSLSSSNDNNNDNNTEDVFQPPAATWYDESQYHFLALLERQDEEEKKKKIQKEREQQQALENSKNDNEGNMKRNLSFGSFVELNELEDEKNPNNKGGKAKKGFWGVGGGGGGGGGSKGAGKTKQKLTEVMYFQTLQVPNSTTKNKPANTNNTTSPPQHIFEPIQRRVTTDEEDQRHILPSSSPLPILLPYKLANVSIRSKPSTTTSAQDPGAATPIKIKRRVPILAKLSLDGTLIALQYTPTMLRIVRIEKEIPPPINNKESQQYHADVMNQKQWTVDVASTDAHPITTNVKTIPPSKRPSAAVSNAKGANNVAVEPTYPLPNNTNTEEQMDSTLKPLIPTQTQILPGGVIWSDHGGNSQDLVVITTTCVIMYKISLMRNNMAKVRMYSHYNAVHFWFEPMNRCLVIGSYAKFDYEKWMAKKKKNKAKKGGKKEEDSKMAKNNAKKPAERIMLMKPYFLRFPPPGTSKSSSVKSLGSVGDDASCTEQQMDSSVSVVPGAAAAGSGPGAILFPRLELPPPERLPMFAVGLTRTTSSSSTDNENKNTQKGKTAETEQKKDSATTTATIAPDEIALVNLYGKVYCVEMGCFGDDGRGIRLHFLEKKNAGGSGDLIHCMTHIPETFHMDRPKSNGVSPYNFVSVLDNVLGIHNKHDRTSFFLDMKDANAVTVPSSSVTPFLGEHDDGDEEEKREGGEDLLFDGTVVVSEEVNEGGGGGAAAANHAGESNQESIFSNCFFFLPPCFLLNSQGRGQIYQMTLDLSTILSAIPRSVCPVPFLLRRGLSHQISHSLAVERLYDLLSDLDDVSLQSWSGAIADAYSQKREYVSQWDDEASIPLVFRAALLPSSTLIHQESGKVFNPFEHAPICSNPPPSCRSVLTQTEVLERAFLPQASLALASSDVERLQFLADVSLDFLAELERRAIDPCPALECLVVALLWRLGDAMDVLSFLQSRQVKKAMVQKKARIEIGALDTGGGGGNAPQAKVAAAAVAASAKSASVGSEVFAEMLLMIATGVELGIGVGEKKDGSETAPALSGIPEWESNVNLKQLLITYAVDILCSTSSHQAATRYLLAMGQIMDAIAVCSKLVVQSLYNTPQPEGSPVPSHGTRAEDFFRVAVECAKKMPRISDRTRLFQHLHTFLKQWDRECFRMESHITEYEASYPRRPSLGGSSAMGTTKRRSSFRVRRSSLGAQSTARKLMSFDDGDEEVCSRLAFNCGEFPNDLFGGKGSPECLLLRQMFGYNTNE